MPQAANDALRTLVIDTLRTIAPEVEAADLQDATPLRQQVDLDSMDWLRFLVALSQRLRIDIPEADYGRLVTLGDVVAYVSNHNDAKAPENALAQSPSSLLAGRGQQ